MRSLWVAILLTTSAQAAEPNADAAKKLEFDDQSISAIDPDYGKLDLTSLKDKNGRGARLYPIRTSFKKEQQEAIGSWGIVE